MEGQIQHNLKAANDIRQLIIKKLKNANCVGQEFLKQFFNPDSDISIFYGNDSILNFENETFIGKDDIVQNIKKLKVSNVPTNYSVQPSNNGVLIIFYGNLIFFGEQDQLPFIRCIFLAKTEEKIDNFYIKNDILKMSPK